MKFSPKLGVTLAALAALGLAASQAANAQVQADLFTASTGGTNFTGTAVSPYTNLATFSAGTPGTTPDGVSLTIGAGIFGNYNDQGAGTTPSEPSALLHQFELVTNLQGATTGTFTIAGLGTTPVDVILYGGTDGGKYTIGSTTNPLTGAGAASPTTEVFTAGKNYVDFGTIAPTSGAISGTWTYTATTGNGFGELAGVQITPAAVPEASSSIGFGILLALGGLAVVARKRTVKA